MLIILLVWFLIFLAAAFVVFVLVLMGGAVSVWGGWVAYRSRNETASDDGKNEIIALLVGLLLLVLCSPVLFVLVLMLLASI